MENAGSRSGICPKKQAHPKPCSVSKAVVTAERSCVPRVPAPDPLDVGPDGPLLHPQQSQQAGSTPHPGGTFSTLLFSLKKITFVLGFCNSFYFFPFVNSSSPFVFKKNDLFI